MSSNMIALQALSLNVPEQDLMLNHLMLATLDPETQREWEIITTSRADTPTTENWSHSWNQDAEPLSYCRHLNH